MRSFYTIDWIVIAIYVVVVFTIGFFLTKKPKSSEDYFLADRKLRWPFIGTSMLASNISAEHFVGLAGFGYAYGLIAGASYEWIALLCILPLIFIFLPLYMRNKIYTVPEYLERRYSPTIRTTLSIFMLVLSILVKVSISLWAGALVFTTLFEWKQILPAALGGREMEIMIVIGLITAIYTMKGGLKAVIYTDAIQAVVLIGAGAVLTVIGLDLVGGWDGLRMKIPAEMFDTVKPWDHPEFPWTGIFIGIGLAGSFYWSMDQVLVQRVFAARDLNEGRKGALFAAGLKLLTPFILVFPGMIALALYPNLAKPDDAYPHMLAQHMPHGLLGLTVAGIAAALMGHLSATYNSIATMFTRDFWIKWKPDASQDQQILVGRIVIIVVALLGIGWAPVISKSPSLWSYLQSVSVYLMMPFVSIFLLGALIRRINTQGVWAAVFTGIITGLPLLVDNMRYGAAMKAWKDAGAIGEAPLHMIPFMNHPIMHSWLHGAILEFVLCTAVLLIVSYMTPAPPAAQTENTVLNWEIFHGADTQKVGLLSDYRFWLVVLTILTVSLYIGFGMLANSPMPVAATTP